MRTYSYVTEEITGTITTYTAAACFLAMGTHQNHLN